MLYLLCHGTFILHTVLSSRLPICYLFESLYHATLFVHSFCGSVGNLECGLWTVNWTLDCFHTKFSSEDIALLMHTVSLPVWMWYGMHTRIFSSRLWWHMDLPDAWAPMLWLMHALHQADHFNIPWGEVSLIARLLPSHATTSSPESITWLEHWPIHLVQGLAKKWSLGERRHVIRHSKRWWDSMGSVALWGIWLGNTP